MQVTHTCQADGNQGICNIRDILMNPNVHYNASRQNTTFVTRFGFERKGGLAVLPYLIVNIVPATERYVSTSNDLLPA